jgi:hypothetical protein
MGLSRLWINLTVEAAIKKRFCISSFLLKFGSRASANPNFFLLISYVVVGGFSLAKVSSSVTCGEEMQIRHCP